MAGEKLALLDLFNKSKCNTEKSEGCKNYNFNYSANGVNAKNYNFDNAHASQHLLSSDIDITHESNCNSEKPKKDYCGKYSFAAKLEDDTGKEKKTFTKVARHLCKTWGCGYCGPRKLKRVRGGIIQLATAEGLTRMLTLTLPGGDFNLKGKGSREYLFKVWSKFRVYLKRKYGTSIKYIWITELQKRGVYHLHVLVDRFIEFEWIKKVWVSLGGGSFVNIKFVDIHRVASYLSKYMTKDMLIMEGRRYGTSKGLALFVKSACQGVWKFIRQDIHHLYMDAKGVYDVLDDEKFCIFPFGIMSFKTRDNFL